MNRKVLFAALFIAMLAATTAFASPATAATTTPPKTISSDNSPAPEKIAWVIPSSLTYDVNGTLIAWLNATGHAYLTSNFPGFSSYNLTVKQLYAMARLSAELSNISTDTTTGVTSATMTVTARVVVKVIVYANSTTPVTVSTDHTAYASWPATWLLPMGSTRNFTIPWASFSMDPTAPDSTNASAAQIRFVDANKTMWSTNYQVDHVQWDFSTWLQNKIQSGLNDAWGKVLKGLSKANIPGFQGGFTVVRCKGLVDVWKTSGTSPDNVLLMADGIIDVLIDFSVVGNGHVSFTYLGHSYSVNYDVSFFVEAGLYLSLTVTSNWQVLTAQSGGHYTYNEVLVQVPENATLVWRKVGVIVYYGSPLADGISVTGGTSPGNTTYGGQRYFFIDYGYNGTPDFATNGTGQPVHLPDDTGTVTGTGTTRTVTLVTKGASGHWVYFKLDTTGYTITSIKRNDGVTLNATQYWVFTDELGNKMLYTCDDPAYSYTVQLTSTGGTSGGLPTSMIALGALAVVVVVAGLLVLTRRKSSSKVSIK